MVKEFFSTSGLIWKDTADPGVSEADSLVGHFWLNTSTGDLFLCKDATIGVQVWDKYPSSVVTVSNGGTGAITLTSNGVLVGNTTSAITATAEGATGTVLIGTTGADPSFSASPPVTSIAIGSGALTITSGAGAPSASVPKGSLYLRSDGTTTNDRMYVATDAAGTWTAVITVA